MTQWCTITLFLFQLLSLKIEKFEKPIWWLLYISVCIFVQLKYCNRLFISLYIRKCRQDNRARNTVCLLDISSNREFNESFASLESVSKDSSCDDGLVYNRSNGYVYICIIYAK